MAACHVTEAWHVTESWRLLISCILKNSEVLSSLSSIRVQCPCLQDTQGRRQIAGLWFLTGLICWADVQQKVKCIISGHIQKVHLRFLMKFPPYFFCGRIGHQLKRKLEVFELCVYFQLSSCTAFMNIILGLHCKCIFLCTSS